MSAAPRMQARIPYDYRQGYWKVINATQLGIAIAGDHGLRVVALCDGLNVKLPGMSADQAEDFGRALLEAAEQARELIRAAAPPVDPLASAGARIR